MDGKEILRYKGQRSRSRKCNVFRAYLEWVYL